MKKILIAIFVSFIAVSLSISAYAGDNGKNNAYWTIHSAGDRITQIQLNAGQENVIRLMAEIPANKNLKAYSLMITFDDSKIAVAKAEAVSDSLMPPVNINTKEAGSVVVNAFNTNGVQGTAAVAILDVTLKGKSAGTADIAVLFSAFGASGDDQFIPSADVLRVTVK